MINNQTNQLMQMINSNITPEQVMQQFPDFAQAYNFMKNQATSNKMSIKDVAMNIAKQNGIDPSFLQKMVNNMDRK